jgi:tryptophan synthase alpha chain
VSRITQTFERLKAARRHALIPYVTAGDPTPEVTVPVLHAAVAAGADILEIGVPFSDPMADGPVIQRSAERALKHRVGMVHVLAMVRAFRAKDAATPIVLMGYANPIEAFEHAHGGSGSFVREASAAGVDGLIVVDYPPEETTEFAQAVRAAGMDLIFLLAPTSTPERIATVAKLASGYIYYVSLAGVTGAGNLDTADVHKHLNVIRAHTNLPIGVGFGIRDGATARKICEIADAAIIGSRIIQEIEAAPQNAPERVGAFLRDVRQAMDAPR